MPRRTASCPPDFDWNDKAALDAAYHKVADALRPWTLDFHVAQNDGTTFGSGDHEKTGRHCQVDDPNGRLDVVKHAGYWLRDDKGDLTKTMRHICWDGCMFPNAVMESQADLEQDPRRDGARCATRTAGANRRGQSGQQMAKQKHSTSAWSATASWPAPTPMPGPTSRTSSTPATGRC